MKCGKDGELVPSGRCSNPLVDGRGCPFIHCEVPITRGPPIIIDPPGREKNISFFHANHYNLRIIPSPTFKFIRDLFHLYRPS